MDIIYIETSVFSHATARPSSDPTTLALQQQAKRWLTEQRPLYDVVTSQLVINLQAPQRTWLIGNVGLCSD
jgi:hypothetical protein